MQVNSEGSRPVQYSSQSGIYVVWNVSDHPKLYKLVVPEASLASAACCQALMIA